MHGALMLENLFTGLTAALVGTLILMLTVFIK